MPDARMPAEQSIDVRFMCFEDANDSEVGSLYPAVRGEADGPMNTYV
jgi:hypothetical protein